MNKRYLFLLILAVALFTGVSYLYAQTTSTSTLPASQWDPTCIQNAVEKRDSTIMAAFDKFYTTMKQALETRKTALKESWAKPTKAERKTAVKAAWKTFKKTSSETRLTFKKEKKAAWRQYTQDRNACKNREIRAIEGGVGEGLDANL